ncbi:MAG: hypothetical protein U0796_00205 [Gemmatales bacterium]
MANDNDDIILPFDDEDFPVPDNDSGFNQAAPFKVVVQRVTITYSDGKMLPPNPMNIIRYKSD